MSDWVPDNMANSQTVGAFDGTGPIAASRKRSNHNLLEHSDDPTIQRLGKWLADCPPEFSSGMAAHTGLMAGIAIGLSGFASHELLGSLAGRGLAPDDSVDEIIDMFAEIVHEWFAN